MSSTVSAPFKLELHRLRWQWALAVGAILGAIVVPWLVQDVPGVVQLACSVAGSCIVTAGLYRAGWLHRQPQCRLVCGSTGEWQVVDRDGVKVHTSLHADTRCFRRFVWLRLVASQTLLIGPGDLDAETFRQLKVVLRRFSAAALSERVA